MSTLVAKTRTEKSKIILKVTQTDNTLAAFLYSYSHSYSYLCKSSTIVYTIF